MLFWSGSKIFSSFFDPDQKFFRDFLIRIKNFSWFLIQDQKIFIDFLIRIKKICLVFWSRSKKNYQKFDPDKKKFFQFLIRIKKFGCDIWSGSWLFHDPDHDFFMIWINIKSLFQYFFLNLHQFAPLQVFCNHHFKLIFPPEIDLKISILLFYVTFFGFFRGWNSILHDF